MSPMPPEALKLQHERTLSDKRTSRNGRAIKGRVYLTANGLMFYNPAFDSIRQGIKVFV